MANGFKGLLPTQADKTQALAQGLLRFGAGMSGGYSDMPISFAQRFAQAGQGFGQGYQGGIEAARAKQLQNMQAQQAQMQMQAQKQNLENQAKQRQAAQRWVNTQKGLSAPGQGVQMGPTVHASQTQPQMDPLEMAMMESDPVGFMQGKYNAQVAEASAAKEFERAKDLKRFESTLTVPKATSLQKEYAQARTEGFPGTLSDFMVMKGMASSGMAPTYGDGGKISYAPVPGSKDAVEAEELKKKGEMAQTLKERSGNIVLQDIDRALGMLEGAKDDILPVTGRLGEGLGFIGYSPAKNLDTVLQPIKAAASFDRLQQMREASPTGGALGAVSAPELRLLESSIGSLEQSQTDEQLAYNLARVKNIYLDIIHGEGNGPARVDPQAIAGKFMDSDSDAELDALLEKY